MTYFNLSDGIGLTFAHAVNSESKLNSTLIDMKIMVLEADVLMDPIRNIPIMAHPPATTSDLSLEDFLTQVLLHSPPKGIKLDFKQLEVVKPSLKLLEAVQKKYQMMPPVLILNADILVGPEDPLSFPVNASRFTELCSKYDQESVLSLGWTTTKAKDSEHPQGYTWEMVTEMHTIVKNLKHRVTFPVRASLVAASRAQLLWLLNLNSDYSLTVWHSSDDLYDVKSMSFLRDKKYIGRVYYDLPDRQIMELKSLPVT